MIWLLCCLLGIPVCMAQSVEGKDDHRGVRDTFRMKEVVISSNARENSELRNQAVSAQTISGGQLRERGAQSLKDLSAWVPGLFIPQYGSRQITSVYMRGVGSRMNTPAVGLYVDDMPWVDKSSFHFALDDVERVEVLRGPQSTLYGRNTMGGLMRVVTRNPLNYQGTDIRLGAAMYNNYKVGLTHYHRVSPKVGFTGGVNYSHSGGFFENIQTGKKVDGDDNLRGRWRMVMRPSDVVSFDLHANYEYSHQGAYPYQVQTIPEDDVLAEQIKPGMGHVSLNRESDYTRHLLNVGLKAEHHFQRTVLSNVTSFQFLKDDMQMDQDFTAADFYTLRQMQNSKVLSEEIVLKSKPGAWKHWEWTTGVSGYFQWLQTNGPVTFRKDGLAWINGMTNTYANKYMPTVQSGPMTMKFLFSDHVQGEELLFSGLYDTPSWNGAVYHQSTVKDLFCLKGLDLTMGMRLGYEKMNMDYATGYKFDHVYGLTGQLTSPFMNQDIAMIPAATYPADRNLKGDMSLSEVLLLPKVSLQYSFTNGNVYATVSEGYRSGGYNFQMFSEVLSSLMRTDIMQDVAKVTIPVVENLPPQMPMPQEARDQVVTMLQGMAAEPQVDVRQLCQYKPEKAWNYEVGAHLDFFDGRLQADASAYLTNITDQQISRMAASGLGRVTVNAGRSRSVGGELALRGRLTDALSAHLNYGYTHSTFRSYLYDNAVSYRGNFVPFVPRHTLDLGARYMWNLKGWIQHLSLSANWHAVGKTYWTEDNAVSEPFYGLLDARVTLMHDGMELSLWGSNLTNTDYRSFYFQSMRRGICQMGRPLQVGVDLRILL